MVQIYSNLNNLEHANAGYKETKIYWKYIGKKFIKFFQLEKHKNPDTIKSSIKAKIKIFIHLYKITSNSLDF